MALTPGQLVAGKYKVERLLAEGGMGAVYVAENQVLQKRVAIKVMNESFASIPGATERFLREGIAASRVSHPAIVQVFDAGQHEGAPWLAMEFLDGVSLGERIATRGPLTVPELLQVCRGVLPALGAVHAQGLIHRDLKPDNIFLADVAGGDFQPKLLDFGVAKDTRAGVNKLTQTGAVVGTASYLAPEQARGAEIDARTDVYAMGAVIYEALSGSLPYEADTLTQLVAKMFTEPPVPLLQVAPQTPRAICDVVSRCLAQQPDQRFAGAFELLAALEAASSGAAVASAQGPIAFASTAIGGTDSVGVPVPPPSGVGPAMGAPTGATQSTPPPDVVPGVAQNTGVTAEQRRRLLWPMLLAACLVGAAVVVGGFFALGGPPSDPQAANTPPVANPPTTADVPAANDLPTGTAPRPGADVPTAPSPTANEVEAPRDVPSTPARPRSAHGGRHAEDSDDPPTPTPTAPTQTAPAPAAPAPVASTAPTPAPTAPLPTGVVHAPRAPLPTGVQAAPAAPSLPRTPTPLRPPPASRDGLSAGQIAPVVSQTMPRMQRCFDRRVRRVPGLHGAVVVRFTILANGSVSDTSSSNGTGDAWMERCVVQNVRHMRFPAATNGASTATSRTYRFGG